MSDLTDLEALLKKANADYGIVTPADDDFKHAEAERTIADKNCQLRVQVMPGYRCHFEAEFDAQGNILNIGQWDEL